MTVHVPCAYAWQRRRVHSPIANLLQPHAGRTRAVRDEVTCGPIHACSFGDVGDKNQLEPSRLTVRADRARRVGDGSDRIPPAFQHQRCPVVHSNAGLIFVAQLHGLEIGGPQDPVALDAIVVRADQAGQETEALCAQLPLGIRSER